MKKLYIIRHAKSSWKDFTLDDFDRPLNRRGKLNAPFMGKVLKNKKVKPDMMISSPALRTKITAKAIAHEIGFFKNIIFDKNIYEASINTVHNILINIDNKNDIIFLFGHNPTLNMLTQSYVEFYENIPTAGIVEIEFNCNSWKDIGIKNGKLISFDYPKRYTL